MGFQEIFGLSFQALRDRKLRAAVTIIMVVVGAALLTGLNGMSAGINQSLTQQFSNLGANIIEVLPGGVTGGTSTRLTDQTSGLIANIEGVIAAYPYIQRSGIIRSGGTSMTTIVLGLDHDKLPEVFPTVKLSDGEFGSPSSPTILLGNSVANPPGETVPFAKVGQVVTLEYTTLEGEKAVTHSRTFLVEGIMASTGSGGFIPIDRMCVIPTAAASSYFVAGGKYDGIFVIASEKTVDSVVNGLKDLFGNTVEIFSAKAILSVINNITGMLGVFLSAVASVSLVVVAVGIFAALYTTVLERTREIGVLKALGFNNRNVTMLFLGEAILIGVIGGGMGDAAGVAIAFLLTSIASGAGAAEGSDFGGGVGGGGGISFIPVFSLETLLSVWIFSIILSVFAGAYPAWRASKLDPVVALRKE